MKRLLLVLLACLLVAGIALPAAAATSPVQLTWGESPTPDDVEYYNVYYGPDPLSWEGTINVGNVTTYTWDLDTIPDGAESTFYFGVSAVDAAGNESAIVTVTPEGETVSLFYDFLAPSPPPHLLAE